MRGTPDEPPTRYRYPMSDVDRPNDNRRHPRLSLFLFRKPPQWVLGALGNGGLSLFTQFVRTVNGNSARLFASRTKKKRFTHKPHGFANT